MTNPVVLITGLSGAGKASILRALEDLGYDAVDNPPLTMVETLVSQAQKPIAVGLDARTTGFDSGLLLDTLDRLRLNPALQAQLVYATADNAVLLRRYTETRRRHPLAPLGRVTDGIEREQALTVPLRDAADLVVDTSDLPLASLRQLMGERFGMRDTCGHPPVPLTLTLMSFAFPAGLPRESDMVFDVRFLRNPHYDPILRPLTGLDPAVAAYVEADPDYEVFFTRVLTLIEFVLPRFVQEGKKYATIAVGCTGGRHRSVRTVERLAPILTRMGDGRQGHSWQVTIVHRELTKAGAHGQISTERGHGDVAGSANSPALARTPETASPGKV
jgi:UPF0042 nucleotide-binding protein